MVPSDPPSSSQDRSDPAPSRAERSLRRADLLDEHAAVEASKRRHFWLTAKWIVPGAVFSALGVSLGMWDGVLTVLGIGLLAVASWVFIGANAREAEIIEELEQLGPEPAPESDDIR